jgi:glycosyltransferase involved in cell wall biosynthesis
MKNPISVLLPVYNEAENIERVIVDWMAQLPSLPPGSLLEIEDANSSDGTKQILAQFEKVYAPSIKVYYRNTRDGFANSIARLIKNSQNEILFIADSDVQYESSDILHFVKKIKNDSDLIFIKGIKVSRNDGKFRKLYSKLINLYCAKIFKIEYLDLNSSHYLISRSLVKHIYPDKSRIVRTTFQDIDSYTESSPQSGLESENNNWTFHKLINIEIALRVVFSNFSYERVYIKHYKRKSGPSRGHPSHKILKDGLQAINDIRNLRKEFFY